MSTPLLQEKGQVKGIFIPCLNDRKQDTKTGCGGHRLFKIDNKNQNRIYSEGVLFLLCIVRGMSPRMDRGLKVCLPRA